MSKPNSRSAEPSGHDILFPPLPYDPQPRLAHATADLQLQQFIHNATFLKDQGRKTSFADVFGPRYDDLRTLAGNVKQHTLDHLDHYLELFIDRATAAGAQVHFAADAAQARAIAVGIAQQRNCKLCVKVKSMVTEEVGLLPALEAAGCQTFETDLAEFIIQLDHDAPSHIVTAMIHKDRKATGRAFTRELGVPYTEDPEQLTQIARAHLRDKYRRADLGISGANFLVASTGSLVICTNEGNGRMCTSAPPLHVALVGIEKLIPDLDHLGLMLKLLARSSTAQPLTIYTHVITGPKRDHDHGGPKELHVILVDNGRTDVLRSESREILRCIRCGACLNTCPVYRKIGGHAYGAVYSGPVGAVLTPLLRGLSNYPKLPELSSLCGACYEACPVKIDIPRQLTLLRRDLVSQRELGWRDRLFYRVWGWSLRHPLTYRLGGWMQKLTFRRMARGSGWVTKLPGPFAGWTQERDMPTPPARSFRQWWRKRTTATQRHGADQK